jgi:hypothetical protein
LGRLFEAIQCLVKFANISGVLVILETRRLVHIYIFIKKSMKKCIL